MTRSRASLPFDEWPAADKAAWERRFASMDVFDPISAKAVWGTRQGFSIGSGYQRWLGYLNACGELGKSVRPEERVTPVVVSRYMDHLRDRCGPGTVYTYIRFLRSAVQALWPDVDWEWLWDIERLLARDRRRIRVTTPLVPIESLYALGFELMDQARRTRKSYPLDQAVLYRDGVMIALQAARPLRRSNLAGIRIGYHLVKAHRRWTLRIPRQETKNRRLYDVLLPEELDQPITRFLTTYRPRFKGFGGHDQLWLSRRGGPLCDEGVCRAIASRTGEAFGVSLYPNHFRACAVTSIAKGDPVNIRAATKLLHHAYISITERYYNRAQTIDASRRYQSHLDALRERLGGVS